MSGGRACQHHESRYVVVRNGNYSAFNGSRFTPSAYSLVLCAYCGNTWRTRAKWVDTTPTLTASQRERWIAGTLVTPPRVARPGGPRNDDALALREAEPGSPEYAYMHRYDSPDNVRDTMG